MFSRTNGDEPWDSLSMPEAIRRAGRELCELDFNTPTQLYHDLKSLQITRLLEPNWKNYNC